MIQDSRLVPNVWFGHSRRSSLSHSIFFFFYLFWSLTSQFPDLVQFWFDRSINDHRESEFHAPARSFNCQASSTIEPKKAFSSTNFASLHLSHTTLYWSTYLSTVHIIINSNLPTSTSNQQVRSQIRSRDPPKKPPIKRLPHPPFFNPYRPHSSGLKPKHSLLPLLSQPSIQVCLSPLTFSLRLFIFFHLLLSDLHHRSENLLHHLCASFLFVPPTTLRLLIHSFPFPSVTSTDPIFTHTPTHKKKTHKKLVSFNSTHFGRTFKNEHSKRQGKATVTPCPQKRNA